MFESFSDNISSNSRYPGGQMFHICVNSVRMFARATNTPWYYSTKDIMLFRLIPTGQRSTAVTTAGVNSPSRMTSTEHVPRDQARWNRSVVRLKESRKKKIRNWETYSPNFVPNFVHTWTHTLRATIGMSACIRCADLRPFSEVFPYPVTEHIWDVLNVFEFKHKGLTWSLKITSLFNCKTAISSSYGALTPYDWCLWMAVQLNDCLCLVIFVWFVTPASIYRSPAT